MARDVFISYRSDDKAAADRLCEALERQNVSCWIAPRDIPLGQPWAEAIVEGLRRCSTFVVVLSANSKNAKQISREAELADQQSLPIITFRIDDVQPPAGLLYFLGNIQWLDAFEDNFDSAVLRLVDVIRRSPNYPSAKTAIKPRLGSPPETPKPPAPAPSAPPPTPAPPPSGWSLHVVALTIGAAALLGLAIWYFTSQPKKGGERTAIPEQTEAAPFALRYFEFIHQGDVARAWAMLGPAYQKRLGSQEGFRAQLQKVGTGSFEKCRPEGCKPAREPGNFECVYLLSSKDGSRLIDRVNIVQREGGGWAIAGEQIEPSVGKQ